MAIMTDDPTESIWKELTSSLGVAHYVQSVQLSRGWGDIVYVTLRVHGWVDDRDWLVANLKSAVASAMGEIRHLVKIEWVK